MARDPIVTGFTRVRGGVTSFARACPVSLSRKPLSPGIKATPKTDLSLSRSLVHRQTWRLKVRLHYAYKVRNLVRCIRDCAVALLRFCGLPTPQKCNGLFTLAWHRTEFDGCLRVIIVRHFEKSDIQFSSLISQHYFRINGNLRKYGNIEII